MIISETPLLLYATFTVCHSDEMKGHIMPNDFRTTWGPFLGVSMSHGEGVVLVCQS